MIATSVSPPKEPGIRLIVAETDAEALAPAAEFAGASVKELEKQ